MKTRSNIMLLSLFLLAWITVANVSQPVAIDHRRHNGEDWHLANVAVESNGIPSYNQPVDSSWAISGRNYPRVIIGEEVSNTINVDLGYRMIAWVIAFISVFVSLCFSYLWYNKKKINSWKEKIGIETRRDLLIFLVVMGVGTTMISILLVLATSEYIVPIQY